MPLPKPREDEDEDVFTDRCMEALAGEYPNASQRRAVCARQWDLHGDDGGGGPHLAPGALLGRREAAVLRRAARQAVEDAGMIKTTKGGGGLVRKVIAASVVKATGDRTFRFVLSTGDEDRDGDRIDPRGWRLDTYNGRVLWAHDATTPAIARCTWIAVINNKLMADAQFPPPGIYPFADQVHDLLAGGFLGEASVGFQPESSTPNGRGVNFHEQSLVEWSIVNVPALPQARIVSRGEAVNTAAVKKWLASPGQEPDEPCIEIADLGPIPVRDVAEAIIEAAREAIPAAIQKTFGVIAEPPRPTRDAEEAFAELMRDDPDEVRRLVREFAADQIQRALKRMRGEV